MADNYPFSPEGLNGSGSGDAVKTTMSDETEPVYVEVPAETKQLAKERLEHGGLTRVCRERLEEIAHGKETSEKNRVKDQLKDLRDKRRELKTQRDEIESELDDIEIKIERAEQRLDEIQDREGEYEGALSMLEEQLADGNHLFIGHGQVQEAAERGNCTQQDVLDDLKERNPTIPDEQFEEKHLGESRG